MSERWVSRLAAMGALRGSVVELVPLGLEHLEPLGAIGLDPDLWEWTFTRVANQAELASYVRAALDERARSLSFPYVIVERGSGRVAGCTRYGNLDEANRRLEIGWTWVGRAWQRTAVNTEAKYLLLETAFAQLGCIRVEFKTDALNARSRAALGRIGAREEGVLRRHMITSTGRVRDTVYFSILDAEWPQVEQQLRARLSPAAPGRMEPPSC